MLAKPVSSACDLRCEYCYYAGKDRLLGVEEARMPLDVLDRYTRQLLAMHGRDAVVEFAWHGGEPTSAGLPFFHEAVRLQELYGKGRKILNTLQTNGTLLDDELCHFFKEKGFLLGVSVDGPRDLHDVYRKGADGRGSFDGTMRGIELLRRHGVPFNTLTAVHDVNSRKALDVYRFLRELTDHMQFLPVVETLPAGHGQDGALAMPPGIHATDDARSVAPFSVSPGQWGAFLCDILEEHMARGAGREHVQIIDVTLGILGGAPSSLCVHDPLCGHSGCVEANGDVYACDRYAFPSYRLGNIMETDMGALMEGNRAFGMRKTYALPDDCFDCPHVELCFGGCPKDRLQGGRNYLCEGYRMFFDAIRERRWRARRGR